jgi:myo-inositol-1(or 4)-monophosphatase
VIPAATAKDTPEMTNRLAAMPTADPIDVRALLALATECAREAGAMLREAFLHAVHETSTKSTPTDLVSQSDFAAERMIREILARERPHDAVLGEEEGSQEGTTGLRWVVDPLDGTVNFLYGIPQWGVSIACEDETGALAAVIFDPMRDELWSATSDEVPRCNGEPVSASDCEVAAEALVATGFGYAAEVRAVQAQVIAGVLPQVRDIRRLGSAALDLAWTSAGRVDAYFERGVKPWDVAAGVLLCRQAGLEIRPLPPLREAPEGLLVARSALADELAPKLS